MPFNALASWGRGFGNREKSPCASGLAFTHWPLGGGRFLGQPLRSPAAETGAPLVEPFVETNVELDETEELEAIEDDELVRWRFFRAANMPRGSSEFIALPLIPHPGRLRLGGNDGGFATAVMRRYVRFVVGLSVA